jgi:chaperonin cofactor prefoldin|tara:strand:+ start:389 stop:547 length:159 start_codon:yes stop_codon:yes gene_type:complete
MKPNMLHLIKRLEKRIHTLEARSSDTQIQLIQKELDKLKAMVYAIFDNTEEE